MLCYSEKSSGSVCSVLRTSWCDSLERTDNGANLFVVAVCELLIKSDAVAALAACITAW